MAPTSAEPGYEKAVAVVLSPSQIKTYLAGNRRWVGEYIAKWPRSSNASADLGSAVHYQLERHLRGEGMDYSTPYKKRAAEIALLGVPLLPPPLTPGMRVENRLVGTPTDAPHDKYFSFQMSNDIVYRGTMDVSVPDSIVVPGLWGGAPACVDHKTSGNISAYSLTEDDLNTDVQAVIYAYRLMSMYQSPVADLAWNYLPTKAKTAVTRRMRVYSPRVVDEFGRIHAHGTEMSSAYYSRPDPLDLPPCRDNAGSGEKDDPCEAYGGCPHKAHCTDVFSPMGFAIPRSYPSKETHMTQLNGTTEGNARMAALEASAPPDPYALYAVWRATAPAAPSAPGYEAFEARFQSEAVAKLQALVPPPPPVVAAPVALPAGIDNAPADFVARPFLLAGMATPVAPPAINPPEYQPAPTLEERAAVLTPTVKEPGAAAAAAKKRVRRTNEEIAAAKAQESKDFILTICNADGTCTHETISAIAVFVR